MLVCRFLVIRMAHLNCLVREFLSDRIDTRAVIHDLWEVRLKTKTLFTLVNRNWAYWPGPHQLIHLYREWSLLSFLRKDPRNC